MVIIRGLFTSMFSRGIRDLSLLQFSTATGASLMFSVWSRRASHMNHLWNCDGTENTWTNTIIYFHKMCAHVCARVSLHICVCKHPYVCVCEGGWNKKSNVVSCRATHLFTPTLQKSTISIFTDCAHVNHLKKRRGCKDNKNNKKHKQMCVKERIYI